MTAPFTGYAGNVWGVVYASFEYFIQKLETTSNPGSLVPLAKTVYTTTINALEAININKIIQAWQAEYGLLTIAETIPINVSLTQTIFYSNRVNALAAAIPALTSILPSISLNAVGPILDQNKPTIADPNLLLWLESFTYETPPSQINAANFISNAQAVSDSFSTVASGFAALLGNSLTQSYDVSVRFAQTAQVAANILQSFTSGPIQVGSETSTIIVGLESGAVVGLESGGVIGLEAGVLIGQTALDLWNQLVTVPALMLNAFLITSAPYTLQVQQDLLLRYLILSIQNQLAQFLLTMRQPLTTQINQALLMIGDSLMDVAARNTNNFENWAAIATANGLLPPYVGATSIPGRAGWGSNLIIPGPGAPTSPAGATPSYNINYLGVDEYVGPINGEMPDWSGDYETISGYNNLRWALGRRIQTTLGSLIYHSTYGCRIPPEVGNIQTASTVGHIAAFGKSALQQDPRVATVLSAFAQTLPEFAVAFQASVQPGGFGSTAISVNEVISPTTAPQQDKT